MQQSTKLLITLLVLLLKLTVVQLAKTSNPFYVIAHMANSKAAVDWAVKHGANAIECDIHFDGSGRPKLIEHGPGCDCRCVNGNDNICVPLQKKCSGPGASENPATYMQHMARQNGIALYFIDSKVGSDMGAGVAVGGC